MRTLHLLSLFSIALALPTTAQAQFSTSGPGAAVPSSGIGGGTWGVALPAAPGVSTASVPVAVTHIDSVVIEGFSHAWGGDVQATLADPTGAEHLLFVRPGYLNPDGASFGTPGEFLVGDFTIVASGGGSLPTLSDGADIAPGSYNQTFDTGGVMWTSGDFGIDNTPLGSIAGPAGDWELRIYDWAAGDSGSFTGWTLNGNSAITNNGNGYCFGDGSGTDCPCSANGAAGEGCLTTSGSGARLTGTGEAIIGNDTFVLTVTGGPANKPGIFFQGTNQLAGNPNADGLLCTVPTKRYDVNFLDANGMTTQTGFGAFATASENMNYQYWFRDTANPCGGDFNFSGGWQVTWQ